MGEECCPSVALLAGECPKLAMRSFIFSIQDSNPRETFAAGGFQDRCLQPLGHPSVLMRRSILNVSGGGIVRKVPVSLL
jgi:hypothetical protein